MSLCHEYSAKGNQGNLVAKGPVLTSHDDYIDAACKMPRLVAQRVMH